MERNEGQRGAEENSATKLNRDLPDAIKASATMQGTSKVMDENAGEAEASRNCEDAVKNEAFMTWLRDAGCDLEKVVWPARDEATGIRGVSARENVSSFEPLFRIPYKLIVSVDVIEKHEVLGPFVREKGHQAPLSEPARMLTLWLAYERLQGEKSWWKHYVNSMPNDEDFDDFVDLWSDEELAALLDPAAARMAIGSRASISLQFSQLGALVKEYFEEHKEQSDACVEGLRTFASSLTQDVFRWACWAVDSRTFLDRRSTENSLPVLIPFADMLNHHPTHADSAEFESNYFAMVADRDLRAGGMLYNSYGRRTNRDLLLTYGFVLQNNPWDYVSIRLPWAGLTPQRVDEPFLRAKLSIISQYPDSDLGHLHLQGAPNHRLLGFFRVWCAASPDELQAVRDAGLESIAVSHERRTLECALDCIMKATPPQLASSLSRPSSIKQSRLDMARIYSETRIRICEKHAQALKHRLRFVANNY